MVVLATGLAVVLLRGRGVPAIRGSFLPNAVTVLAFAIMTGFAVRPYFQTVHAALNTPTQAAMTVWQRADRLPIEPRRGSTTRSACAVFQLPAFVGNIASASAGTVNEQTGTVTLAPTVHSVTVQLKHPPS